MEHLRLRAFTPDLSPLLVALATTLLAIVALASTFSRSRLAAMEPASLRAEVDDDAAVVAGRLLRMGAPSAPVRVFLGGSALREAVDDSAHGSILNFATSGQTLSESLAILETLSLAPGSTVVVHLTPMRLGESQADAVRAIEHPRMPFVRTEALVHVLGEAGIPVSTWPDVVRNREWMARFLRRRLDPRLLACEVLAACTQPDAPWRPIAPYRVHQYADSVLPPAVKDSLATLYNLQVRLVSTQQLRLGQAIILEMAGIAAARKLRLILVQLPADPGARKTEDLFYSRADVTRLRGHMEAAGVRIVDLRPMESRLPSSSFYDLHHVRSSTRMALDTLMLIGSGNGP